MPQQNGPQLLLVHHSQLPVLPSRAICIQLVELLPVLISSHQERLQLLLLFRQLVPAVLLLELQLGQDLVRIQTLLPELDQCLHSLLLARCHLSDAPMLLPVVLVYQQLYQSSYTSFHTALACSCSVGYSL